MDDLQILINKSQLPLITERFSVRHYAHTVFSFDLIQSKSIIKSKSILLPNHFRGSVLTTLLQNCEDTYHPKKSHLKSFRGRDAARDENKENELMLLTQLPELKYILSLPIDTITNCPHDRVDLTICLREDYFVILPFNGSPRI